MLYDEMDWMKVADSLNSSLPEGGQYTNLELKSFQIASSQQFVLILRQYVHCVVW
ncbi:MAG: hypothetical protein V9G11_09625 [Bifidobacterium adolescentis]